MYYALYSFVDGEDRSPICGIVSVSVVDDILPAADKLSAGTCLMSGFRHGAFSLSYLLAVKRLIWENQCVPMSVNVNTFGVKYLICSCLCAIWK